MFLPWALRRDKLCPQGGPRPQALFGGFSEEEAGRVGKIQFVGFSDPCTACVINHLEAQRASSSGSRLPKDQLNVMLWDLGAHLPGILQFGTEEFGSLQSGTL